MNVRLHNDYFASCSLRGTAGDAFGAPIEFMSTAEIQSRYGPEGLQDYAPAYWGGLKQPQTTRNDHCALPKYRPNCSKISMRTA